MTTDSMTTDSSTNPLTHNNRPIEDYTEDEIGLMEPKERQNIIDSATRFVVRGGNITPEQCAILVRLLIYTRRRAVKDNPRASAAARQAAEVTPATLDDI